MSKFLNTSVDAANTALSNITQAGINRIQSIAGSNGGGAVNSVNSLTGNVILTSANVPDSLNKRYVTDVTRSNALSMLQDGNQLKLLNIGQTNPMQIFYDSSTALHRLQIASDNGSSIIDCDSVTIPKTVNSIAADNLGNLDTTLKSQGDVVIAGAADANILAYNSGISKWYNATTGDLSIVTLDASQSLANKDLTDATNTIRCTQIQDVQIDATPPTVNQVLVATSSTNAVWSSLSVPSLSSLSDVDLVAPANLNLLQYNGVDWVNNATIDNLNIPAVVDGKQFLAIDGDNLQNSFGFSSDPSTGMHLGPATELLFTLDGARAFDVSPSEVAIYNGANRAAISAANVLGAVSWELPNSSDTFVGLDATQVLTNKDLTDATNAIRATQILDVQLNGSPITGDILIADNALSATWQPRPTEALADLSDCLIVAPAAGQLLSYSPSNNWQNIDLANSQIPASLTAKKVSFIDGTVVLPSITFDSNPDSGIFVPNTSQINVSLNASNVAHFEANGLAIYNTSGANKCIIQSSCTGTKTYILNDMVASSDTFIMQNALQGLSNKIITNSTIDSNTNTVSASKLHSVVVSGTAPSASQVLQASDSMNASWVTLASGSTTFSDATFEVFDSVDTTKRVKFDAAALPTATTVTYTMPSTATTGQVMLTQDSNATLTNKVYIAPNTASVSSPGFTFSGELNSGLYRVGASVVGISLAGIPQVNFESASLKMFNAAGTFYARFDNSAIAGNQVISVPNAPGNRSLVLADFAQTVTNKTTQNAVGSIAAPSYSFSGATNTGFSYQATGIYVSFGGLNSHRLSSDSLWIIQPSGNSIQLQNNNTVGNMQIRFPDAATGLYKFVLESTTQTLTAKTITDTASTTRSDRIATTGSSVVISATAPSSGMTIVATSATNAAWTRCKFEMGLQRYPNVAATSMTFVSSATLFTLAMGTEASTNVTSSTSFTFSVNGPPVITYVGTATIDLQLNAVILYTQAGNSYRSATIYKNNAASTSLIDYSQTGANGDRGVLKPSGYFKSVATNDTFQIYISNETNTAAMTIVSVQFQAQTMQQQ